MSDALKAIEACRTLVRLFIEAELDYGAFRGKMATAMAPLDPLDWAVDELSADQQEEATLYVKWLCSGRGVSRIQRAGGRRPPRRHGSPPLR